MFDKFTKGYDFWGYCDLDVIFGNLRDFFTDEKLEKFDKIYDAGHLSIYRNSNEVKKAFMGNETYKVPYKDIFNHKYNCIFDEYYGNNAGIDKFANFLRTFVDLEIPHIQFNVVRKEDLLAAKKNPEQYRGLTVRVAGYTAYFTELADELQNEIIARTSYGDI